MEELENIKEKIEKLETEWPEEKILQDPEEKIVLFREKKSPVDFLKSSFNLLLLIAGISSINFGISMCLIFLGASLLFPLIFFAAGFFVILVFSIICVKTVYSQNRNSSYTML